jgi:ABC-2 type transport system permease protein
MSGRWMLVAEREIAEGLRSKGFRIATALSVVAVVALAIVPQLVGGDDDEATQLTVAVLDGAPAGIDGAIDTAAASVPVTVERSTISERAAADVAVADGDVDVAFAAPEGGSVGAAAVVEGAPDGDLASFIELVHRQIVLTDRVDAASIGADAAADLFAPVEPAEVVQLDDPDEIDGGRFLVGFAAVILIFMALQLTGQAILLGVLNEKSTRVIEVLLSSASARSLLFGKLVGVGILGMAQVLVLAGTGLAVSLAIGSAELPSSTVPTLLVAVPMFLLAYAIYGTCFAVAGALVDKVEDAQSSATPITLLMTGAYIAAFVVALPSPNGFAARALTWFPFSTPIVGLARTAVGETPVLDLVIGSVLGVVLIVVLLTIAARVYRGATLRFGSRVKLREVL